MVGLTASVQRYIEVSMRKETYGCIDDGVCMVVIHKHTTSQEEKLMNLRCCIWVPHIDQKDLIAFGEVKGHLRPINVKH